MDAVTSGHAAALWVGLHLILLLVLSLLVVRQRRRHKVALGDGGVPELAQAIRAFGNATEYVPAARAWPFTFTSLLTVMVVAQLAPGVQVSFQCTTLPKIGLRPRAWGRA